MIFKILDAYEEEIKSEDSFFKKVVKMNNKKKRMLIVMVIMTIVAISIVLLNESNIVSSICMIVFGIITLIIAESVDKDRKRNYINNVSSYNNRLDRLKALLTTEEFSICSKGRLEALIKKINIYLEENNRNEKEKKQGNNQFNTTIIIPSVTFILGVLTSEMKSVEVVEYGIVVLLFILCFRYMGKEIIDLFRELSGTTPIKMKYLVKELQDLYDRNYIE